MVAPMERLDYSAVSSQVVTGLFAYFFLKTFLRNRNREYTLHSTRKITNAIMALVVDLEAKPSRNSSGAIITIAGKLERIYRLEVGVRRLGSISFIRIIPLEAVPVIVP